MSDAILILRSGAFQTILVYLHDLILNFNYFVYTAAGRYIIDQFLEHYFALYDSTETTQLEDS